MLHETRCHPTVKVKSRRVLTQSGGLERVFCFFFPAAAKRHLERCRLVTRLSCFSFDYSRNISPPPLSVFDFPLRGQLSSRAEIRQAWRGPTEGSSLRVPRPPPRLQVDKKHGDAYAIRAETLSDLISVRGFSCSLERVLLIHFTPAPPPWRYGLYGGG